MLVEMNWQPSTRQLRQFGVGCLIVFPLLVWFWGAESFWITIAATVGLAIAMLSWFSASVVRPLFIGLSLLAIPIGMVVGELMLILLYAGVFLPIGMLFRVLGRDALHRKLDPSATSHWSEKKTPSGVRSYYQQF